MNSDRFLRDNATWLGAGILLTFSSSVGQTFFIALFAEPLREKFSLSNGDWGGLYTIATFFSAASLLVIGRVADVVRVRTLAMMIYGGLIVLAVAMANVNSVIMLGVIIYGLRLCGQGMMTHIAITAMARWFARRRGRAVAIAGLGVSLGEGFIPVVAVSVIGLIGWQDTWLAAAVVLGVILAPTVFFMLRHERKPGVDDADHSNAGMQSRHWSRGQVLQHWFFWALIPGMMIPSFTVTAVFFHQAYIVADKGWLLSDYVLTFPVFSGCVLLFSFISGLAIDRFGCLRILPVYLLPMSGGLIVLGLAGPVSYAYFYMGLMGATSGIASTLLGTLRAEMYGTRNLGAIRSLAIAVMVLGTALGPGVMGALIDWGISVETQMFWMAAYTTAISFVFALISRKITIERRVV